MKATDASSYRLFAVPGYFVGALLILIPIVDSSISLLPLRVGEVGWRFGAMGIASQAVMTPLLGGLICMSVAALSGHRIMLRVVEVVGWLAALLMLGFCGMFVLDAVQMRANVRPEFKGRFDKAAVVALLKYGAGALAAGWLAFSSHRFLRRGRSKMQTVDQANLVVGMPSAHT